MIRTHFSRYFWRGFLPSMAFLASVSTLAAQIARPDLPKFEVASIRLSEPGGAPQPAANLDRALAGVGGRVSLRNTPLTSLLMKAFAVGADQISGPAWMASQLFDISAAAPATTPPEKIPAMLQQLLIERFKLEFHRENSIRAVYALVQQSGGAKLKLGIPDDSPDALGQMGEARRSADGSITAKARAAFGVYTLTSAGGVTHYEFQNISMQEFAGFLSPGGARGFLDLPVINATELPGRYQVTLDVAISEMHGGQAALMATTQSASASAVPTASDPPGSSIRASLEKQGLRLVRREVAFERFVIDHVERTPTEN